MSPIICFTRTGRFSLGSALNPDRQWSLLKSQDIDMSREACAKMSYAHRHRFSAVGPSAPSYCQSCQFPCLLADLGQGKKWIRRRYSFDNMLHQTVLSDSRYPKSKFVGHGSLYEYPLIGTKGRRVGIYCLIYVSNHVSILLDSP